MVFENVAKRHQVSYQNLEEALIRVPYVVRLCRPSKKDFPKISENGLSEFFFDFASYYSTT